MELKERIETTKQIIESFGTAATDFDSDNMAHFRNELAIMEALERIERDQNCEQCDTRKAQVCFECHPATEQG